MGDILRQALFAHMPIIRDIVYGAASHGGSLNELCIRLRIPVADLDDSDKKADFETACLAWEHAVKMTGDPLLGLHVGQSTNPSIMGLVGYLMQNSRTLLEAFRHVCDYGRIATNMFDYRIVERKDEVMLQFVPVAMWRQLYPNGARQAVEQAMAGTLNVFYLLSGKKIWPLKADHPAGRKKDRFECEEVFRAPVSFDGRIDQLTFRGADLMSPVLRSDRSLLRVFRGLARQKRGREGFKDRLRDLILNEFSGITPPIEVLASKLNMTVRSLQRRLAAEKTSFRRLSGQISKEVATNLLSNREYRVVDIARILGYSSPRSFRRAYQKLTKRAPSRARKS